MDATPVKLVLHKQSKILVQRQISQEQSSLFRSGLALGIHTAFNQINVHNYDFYWGFKGHVLIDRISDLSIAEIT